MEKVKVELGEKSYPIYIGKNIMTELGRILRDLFQPGKALIISNETVYGPYGERVRKSLEEAGFRADYSLIGDGEEYKTLETAAYLYDQAMEKNLDRHSLIIALGGGVVGDMAGFIAATFMRGIPFVQVPTTLLAQVDSSVGGKVAVNHPKGKNIIGAFYQPRLVLSDIAVFQTLPEREIKTGLAEVVKYGIIWDKEFFNYLDGRAGEIRQLHDETILKVVRRSCAIKAAIVAEDEREQGLRAILNFGHTFGHALEALTQYKVYRHGEAVAIGMAQAAYLAELLGLLAPGDRLKIVDLLQKLALPVAPWESFDPRDLVKQMVYDKKVQNNQIRFVLPKAIGQVTLCQDVPLSLVEMACKPV